MLVCWEALALLGVYASLYTLNPQTLRCLGTYVLVGSGFRNSVLQDWVSCGAQESAEKVFAGGPSNSKTTSNQRNTSVKGRLSG